MSVTQQGQDLKGQDMSDYVAVTVNGGSKIHAADPVALEQRNPYAVECGAVRVRGARSARYYRVDAEISCSKCRKAYGIDS